MTTGVAWRPVDREEAPTARPTQGGFTSLLFPEETWLAFGLMVVLAFTTALAVEQAKWVQEMPGLTGMAIGALLIGYVLARMRVPAILLHPVGAVIGLLVILWQAVNAAAGESMGEKIVDAAVRLYDFGEVVQGGGISTDGFPFIVQVLIFTWLVGYLAAWFLYRTRNAWLAILPLGITLLINLTYLPGRFTGNFVVFVAAAMLLVMLAHGTQQHLRWRRADVPRREVAELSPAGPALVFGGLLLMVAFLLPLMQQSLPVMVAWERATGPWRSFEREFDRLFASVSSGRAAPLHTFGRAMPFRGAVNFGDQHSLAGRVGLARDEIMTIEAGEPGYWRAESYDTYTGQGWIAADRDVSAFPEDPVPGAAGEYKDRKPFSQTVELSTPMDVLFAQGLPMYGNLPANSEMRRGATFTLVLSDPAQNRGLQPELQDLAQRLRQDLESPGRLFSRRELQRLLPPDLAVVSRVGRGAEIAALEVRRTVPFPRDVASVRPVTTIDRGRKYSITSSVSMASAEALRKAVSDYPGWVTDHYLQMPDALPERVKALARAWTQDAETPYDKASAIEAELREIAYSTNIPPPPRNRDGVDYFLFELNRGYADYYASAMAMLLRSLAVPARVSVGYVAGDWDTEKEHYVVREAHAHAWTEVFFPEYGWAEFNPSPNWPTVPRRFDNALLGDLDGDLFDDEDDDLFPDDEDLEEGMGDFPIVAGGNDLAGILKTLGWFLATLVVLWLLVRFLWLYGLSRLPVPVQTYEKMCRLAFLARLASRSEQTPYEYARALATSFPSDQGAIGDIARGYARARYSPREMPDQELGALKEAWRNLRWTMLLKVFRLSRRWRGQRA